MIAIAELSKKDLDVIEFAGRDHTRPMLQHVLVRMKDGRVELIATDSYTMIIHSVEAKAAAFDPFIVHRSVFEDMKKVAGTHEEFSRLRGKTVNIPDVIQLGVDSMEIETRGITKTFKSEEEAEKYPDIDRLLKGVKADGTTKVGLNSSYVERAMKFLKKQTDGRSVSVQLHGKLDPVYFELQHTLVIVMPVKT